MVTVMIAGQPVNFGALTTVYQQAKTSPLYLPGPTIIGTTSKSYSYASDASLQRNASIFSNILSGGELPETFRESVTSSNLINLGRASIDISNALKTVASGLQSQISNLTRTTKGKTVEQEIPIEKRDIQKSSSSTFSDLGKKIEPYVPYVILGGIALLGIKLLRR